jgi:hypothetical protein
VRDFELRDDKQRQLVAELMRLIGMPQVNIFYSAHSWTGKKTLFSIHSLLYVAFKCIVLKI